MTRAPSRAGARRTGWAVLTTLVVTGGAVIGIVEHRSSASSATSIRPPIVAEHLAQRPRSSLQGDSGAAPGERVPGELHGPAGEADGVLPGGANVTVFDDQYPAVSKLDPALLHALRRAASDAAH